MDPTLMHYVKQVLSIGGAALFMVFFFGFCIFIHELGHFIAARLCGLHVIAFSIGFKKVWCFERKGIEYRIGCIPFGGYVDLPQIDSSSPPVDENGNSLPKASPYAKMVTAFAGPFFNFLFGLFLGCFIWIFGLPQDTPSLSQIKVKTVEIQSPEYEAGLRPNDVIVKLNGRPFHLTWNKFVNEILMEVGDTSLEVIRNGKPMTIVYKTKVNKGIAPSEEIAYPFFRPEIPVILFPQKSSPAAKAGLKNGDRVVAIDGKEIYGIDDLEQVVLYSINKELTISYLRDGKPMTAKVTPEQRTSQPHSLLMIGISQEHLEDGTIKVGKVQPGMPADGVLLKDDLIVAIDKQPISQITSIIDYLETKKGAPVDMTVKRGTETLQLQLKPKAVLLGSIGVSYAIRTYPNPIKQFQNVLELTYRSLRGVIIGLRTKLGFDNRHTTLKPSHFSGPIGIGRVLYISVYRGSIMLGINLVVIITFNLGLLNLLPIPVLDGGHIMLSIYEAIFKRPLPARLLQPVTIAFVSFLIGFMLFVTFFDVKKLFGL